MEFIFKGNWLHPRRDDTQTDKEEGKQTHRQTKKKINRHTDKL